MLYRLSYLGLNENPGHKDPGMFSLAGATGFEPAISGVTGRRPKPLGHAPVYVGFRTWWAEEDSNLQPLACDASALPIELSARRLSYYSKGYPPVKAFPARLGGPSQASNGPARDGSSRCEYAPYRHPQDGSLDTPDPDQESRGLYRPRRF